jgi:hypothetical protein
LVRTYNRTLRYAIAGAIAGVIIFLLVNPVFAKSQTNPAVLMGLAVGTIVGCCLVLAEELGMLNAVRLRRVVPIALATGAVGGGIAGLVEYLAMSLLFKGFALDARHPSPIVLALVCMGIPLVNIAGWALAGAAAGVCVGAAYRDARKALYGAIGGAVGGGVGGVVIDVLAESPHYDPLNCAFGFVALGVAIGAGVAVAVGAYDRRTAVPPVI